MSVCNELQPFLIAKCRLEKWQQMGGDELIRAGAKHGGHRDGKGKHPENKRPPLRRRIRGECAPWLLPFSITNFQRAFLPSPGGRTATSAVANRLTERRERIKWPRVQYWFRRLAGALAAKSAGRSNMPTLLLARIGGETNRGRCTMEASQNQTRKLQPNPCRRTSSIL